MIHVLHRSGETLCGEKHPGARGLYLISRDDYVRQQGDVAPFRLCQRCAYAWLGRFLDDDAQHPRAAA